jgi:NADH-quinone oxidoreductase subunit N
LVIVESLTYILPEAVLVGMACIHFLFGPFLAAEGNAAATGVRHRWGFMALIALLAAGTLWGISKSQLQVTGYQGPFRLDELAWYIRGLSLAAGIVLLLISWNQVDDAHAAESHALLLLVVAGVSLAGAANDLVGLFLALELVSIPTYVLLYLQRRDADAQEATTKYFLLSIFSSALVLFGFSYLYGITGTTNLAALHDALWNAPPGPPSVLVVAIVTIVAGLSFRITAVPFHFYAPDVFQGTGTPAAALLAYVPKIVGFVALLRIFAAPAFNVPPPHWTLLHEGLPVLWVLAVVTMFVGNLMALAQTNIKRLLAYSSIAHAGYMLVGLTVGRENSAATDGVEALLFYLAVYGAMTVGVFASLVSLSRPGRPIENIDDLAGVARTNPGIALPTAIFLFSLTGLPPTAGFFGKLNLFLAAWSRGTPPARWLAAILAVNAAIGAWYYLRLIAVMYLQPPAAATEKTRWTELPALVGVVLCVMATVGLFIAPGLLWQVIEQIST